MRKETLGAALFFCGFGLFISFCNPLEPWVLRLIISTILMIVGLKIGGCC